MRFGWLILLSGPAAAQVTATVDVGAGAYRPDRATPGGVASIAPWIRYHGRAVDLDLAGTYTDVPDGRWNFQGATAGTIRALRLGRFSAELVGEADWTSHYQAEGTAALTGTGRLAVEPSRWTRLWLGRGAGAASVLGRGRAVRRTELGTSASVAGIQLGFTVLRSSWTLMGQPTAVSTPEDTLIGDPEPRDTTALGSALTDATVSGRWRLGTVGFDASLGRRFGRSAPGLTLWGLSAYRGITPLLEFVASAGRSGSDPVTAVPGSRYFALGLRLRVRAGPPPLLLPPTTTADAAPFHLGPALGSGREIVIRLGGAHRVELAGDFTDWRPIALDPWGEGAWRTIVTLPRGLHRLAVRVDGGAWRAPPGLKPITSEFGGEVAEIVVE
ncbi:MAG TPA: glycogen-binding domain-containing protein [Gemmatimonadales bacterium]|nr:glycogen-binding domain-containing protein [Gemmatimonadales bacterium]